MGSAALDDYGMAARANEFVAAPMQDCQSSVKAFLGGAQLKNSCNLSSTFRRSENSKSISTKFGRVTPDRASTA
jgi:hypothetical protein